jgi:hypothetical protein
VGRAELAARDPAQTAAVAARQHGFAAITADGYLEFRADDGARLRSPAVRLSTLAEPQAFAQVRATAEPGSGLIAVVYPTAIGTGGAQLLVVRARRAREAAVLAQAWLPGPATGIAMHGHSQVIVAADRQVSRWEITPGRDPAWSRYPSRLSQVAAGPAGAGARDLIMAGRPDAACVLGDSGTVRYLDPGSLQPAAGPRVLAGRAGTALWASADGATHALGGDGFADVATCELADLQALADRPQAAWLPADLVTVARVAPVIERCPAARPLYALIAACLEHRFAGDVRLGRAPAGAAQFAGADDIEISPQSGEVPA